MLRRVRVWFLACAILALLCGCGSSGTLVRMDGGATDAMADAYGEGIDSAAPADTGGADSTVAPDSSTLTDTSTVEASIDSPGDGTPPLDSTI